MIAATSNSTLQDFRSTMPVLWTFAVACPGIPCHLAGRLSPTERRIAANGGLDALEAIASALDWIPTTETD